MLSIGTWKSKTLPEYLGKIAKSEAAHIGRENQLTAVCTIGKPQKVLQCNAKIACTVLLDSEGRVTQSYTHPAVTGKHVPNLPYDTAYRTLTLYGASPNIQRRDHKVPGAKRVSFWDDPDRGSTSHDAGWADSKAWAAWEADTGRCDDSHDSNGNDSAGDREGEETRCVTDSRPETEHCHPPARLAGHDAHSEKQEEEHSAPNDDQKEEPADGASLHREEEPATCVNLHQEEEPAHGASLHQEEEPASRASPHQEEEPAHGASLHQEEECSGCSTPHTEESDRDSDDDDRGPTLVRVLVGKATKNVNCIDLVFGDSISHEQFDSDLEGAATVLAAKLSPQVCTDGIARLHQQHGHSPYKADCEVCVRAAGRKTAHKRTGAPRLGSLCLDLCQLNKGRGEAQVLVATQPVPTGQIIVTETIADKSTPELKRGIAKILAVLSYTYIAPAVQRVHSDKESGIVALTPTFEATAISYTHTQGSDPTASGECAVGLLTAKARALLDHFSDRDTRRKLWTRAMENAAEQLNAQHYASARFQRSDLLPLGAKVMVLETGENDETAKKLDRNWKKAIFLHTSHEVPGATVVAIIDGRQIVKISDYTTVKPLRDGSGNLEFPDVKVTLTAAEADASGSNALRCGACGKTRFVRPSAAAKLRDGFHCDRLNNADCATPEGQQVHKPRRGRPAKRPAIANVAAREPPAWDRQSALAEIGGFKLTDKQLSELIDDLMGDAPSPIDLDLPAEDERGKSLVTKLVSDENRDHPNAAKCIQNEVDRFIKYSVWDDPVHFEDAKHVEGAVWARVALIVSEKHIEKKLPHDERTFKARIVLHGHRLYLVKDNTRFFVASTELWSPTLSLQGLRVLIARALLLGRSLLSTDIASAYLQQPWPNDVEPMFCKLPESLVRFLPAHMRPANTGSWLYPMKKCVYGHPRSGGLFIRGWIDTLKQYGWEPCRADKALLYRPAHLTGTKLGSDARVTTDKPEPSPDYDVTYASYVDDALSDGVDRNDGSATPWAEVATRYEFAPPEFPHSYIGLTMQHVVTDKWNVVYLETKEYAAMIVDDFTARFPKFNYNSDAPYVEEIYQPSDYRYELYAAGQNEAEIDGKRRAAAATEISATLTLLDRQH
ncbi:MAG: hypothetical protein OSB14_08445, partial [Planctomycetota bacterium]|nr:hypothetical protein [Planctomycetota bacterium]